MSDLEAHVEAPGRDKLVKVRSHGYLQTSQPDYMLTLVDRGIRTRTCFATSTR